MFTHFTMWQWAFRRTRGTGQESTKRKPGTGSEQFLCDLGMLDMERGNGSDNRDHAIVLPTEDMGYDRTVQPPWSAQGHCCSSAPLAVALSALILILVHLSWSNRLAYTMQLRTKERRFTRTAGLGKSKNSVATSDGGFVPCHLVVACFSLFTLSRAHHQAPK